MREFKLGHGSVTLPLESSGDFKVVASSKQAITVFAVSGKEKIPIANGTSLDFRQKLSPEFSAVEISVHGNSAFGYWFQEHQKQGFETLNDLDPPALPEPRADNLVAKLHHELRQLRRMNSPARLEPEFDSWSNRYQIEHDDFDFEEEIAARAHSQQMAQHDDQQADLSAAKRSEPLSKVVSASAEQSEPVEKS